MQPQDGLCLHSLGRLNPLRPLGIFHLTDNLLVRKTKVNQRTCKDILVYNQISTVAIREYTVITLGDPAKVLISCWGLKDNTHLSAFVRNNAPSLAWM